MILSRDSWAGRVVGAGMLGLAGLAGVSSCQPTPPSPQPDTVHVMVLDEFPAHQNSGSVTHGTLVEQVLRSQRPVQNERIQVSLGASMEPVHSRQPGGLDQYVVQRFSVPTRATAEALSQLEGPGVASQSQGSSASRVVESLWNEANHRPEIRSFLESELGLAPVTGDSEFLQALVHRVDDLHRSHPEIRDARRELLSAARSASEQGIIRVLSAGNNGHLDETLERLQVSIPRDFYLSDLADPAAIIVGAADLRGTADPSDDIAALIASPGAGALVGAQGVDVPIQVGGELQHHSGSSYAQPQVAALIAGWLQESPGLTRDQIAQRLQQEARPVPGAESKIGAGIIDSDWNLTR